MTTLRAACISLLLSFGALHPLARAQTTEADPAADPAAAGETTAASETAEAAGDTSTDDPSMPSDEPVEVEPEEASPPTPDTTAAPLPPDAAHPQWGWIELENGERLGGHVLSLRDGTLRFHSDVLGDQSVAWHKVRRYHSPHVRSYVTRDLVEHIGTAEMTDGLTLAVETANGTVTIPRSEVLSITGAASELERWSFHLDAGVNAVDGTLDQVAFHSSTTLARVDGYTAFQLGHTANYGISNGIEAVHNQWGTARLDVFASNVFFLTPLTGTVGYDVFQNIEFRATPGAGFGAHILDGGPDWDIALLGVYQYVAFRQVEVGRAHEQNSGGGALVTHFDWDVFGADELHIAIDHRSVLVYDGADLDASNFRTTLGIETKIIGQLHATASGTWDRVLNPEPLQDGTRPQADTWTLVVGIGVDLD